MTQQRTRRATREREGCAHAVSPNSMVSGWTSEVLACHNLLHAPTQSPSAARRVGPRPRRRGRRAALRGPAQPPLGPRGAGGRACPRRGARTARPGGHASFRDGRTVDHARQRLRPARGPARLRLGHHDEAARRPHAARVGAVRGRQGDRGRARRHVRRLDLQRPHPRPDAALPRGRAAADHVRQRVVALAHDPFPRDPPVRDGRRPRARRRRDRPRRRAPSTSSTPSRPACISTTATSGRSPSTSRRASTARSSSTRPTGARTPTSS